MRRTRAWLLATFLLVFGLVGALHVHDPGTAEDNDCPICHVLSLGSSGVAPDLVFIAIAWTGETIDLAPAELPVLQTATSSPFQSRGPPALI